MIQSKIDEKTQKMEKNHSFLLGKYFYLTLNAFVALEHTWFRYITSEPGGLSKRKKALKNDTSFL